MSEGSRNDRRRHVSRPAIAKRKNKKKIDKVTIIGFVALALVLGVIFGAYMWMQADKAAQDKKTQEIISNALPEGVIAELGNLKISTSDYAVIYFEKKLQIDNKKNGENQDAYVSAQYWRTGMEGKVSSMEALKQSALQTASFYTWELDKVNSLGIKLTDAELKTFEKNYQSQMDQMKSQFGNGADEKTILNVIYHVTPEQYKSYQKNSFLLNKYQTSELKKISAKITKKEELAYYNKNKGTEFANKFQVQHILIKTPVASVNPSADPSATPSPADKAKQAQGDKVAKAKADSILAMAKKGTDFTKLVLKYSQDKPAATTGTVGQGLNGIYDVASDSGFVAEFKNWALDKKHKPGALGIVKTQFGFHIMKQLVSGQMPFESAKKGIIETLAQTKLNTDLSALFSKAPKATMNDDVYAMLANIVIFETAQQLNITK